MATDARQYLISFLATLKGEKAVVRGLRSMEREITKTQKTMGVAGKSVQSFGAVIGNLTKRALLTIPVWLVLRSVFMGLIRTVGDVIRSNIQLEEQMARIRTVMHGTAQEIDRDMALVKGAILDMAVKSRASLKDLAEGFYFLRTSNLDTKQALEAFTPAVNLAIGTGNSLKETTRALAGVYNTMGNAITETMSDAEAFQRIADVLAFTYATQDVQLSELISSYEKFAPFVSGLDDSFVDIVTTLGFLNTRLLRAGRAGRLTGRAILQLSKNAEKLASIFGITFDPDKPINFVSVMKQVHSAIADSTKLTEKQSRAIQEVFATRGAVPIRLLLESFEEWNDALQLAGENAEGFAQRMQEIRMDTVSAQADRFKNILAVLGNEFITGATGGQGFAESLKIINDWLVTLRAPIRAVGDMIGFVSAKIGEFSVIADQLRDRGFWGGLSRIDEEGNVETLAEALKEIRENVGSLTLDEYIQQQDKAVEKAEEEKKIREELNNNLKELQGVEKIRTNELEKQKAEIANQVKIMKIMGAHEKDIAKYKLEQLDTLAEFMTLEEEQLARLKAENELIQAQARYRQDMLGIMRDTALNILKIMGASESQILEIKIRQLQLDRENIGEAQFMLQLTKLRHQQQLALLQEKQRELQVATSLYQQYKQADEFERTRLRRLMELRQLSPEELAERYKENMFDQRIIDEYFSHFSQEGQQAIGEVIRKMFDLPMPAQGGLAELPIDELRTILGNPDLTTPFWDNWMVQARERLNEFKQEWERVFTTTGGLGTVGQTIQDRIAIDQNIDLGTKIENVEVNLPENALDDVAQQAGEQLKEALLSNEDFQKKFIDRIRRLL